MSKKGSSRWANELLNLRGAGELAVCVQSDEPVRVRRAADAVPGRMQGRDEKRDRWREGTAGEMEMRQIIKAAIKD